MFLKPVFFKFSALKKEWLGVKKLKKKALSNQGSLPVIKEFKDLKYFTIMTNGQIERLYVAILF